MQVSLVIFGLIALLVLFQLFNVLGKKTGFKVDDQPLPVKAEDDKDNVMRIERRPEITKITNLDQLKARDSQFNELNFLEKTRETYEAVVMAFNGGDVGPVKDKLSEAVFKVFSDAVAARPQQGRDLNASFVGQPKADFESIDVTDDMAKVKVRFLSELIYNEPTDDVAKGAAQKTHRRTAEFWTFQKNLKSMQDPWILIKVEAAKA
jgi:predicted lipid-binding transport protein (Tim44 family)